jgi:WS/DGAT/MGAT family acyltransferase
MDMSRPPWEMDVVEGLDHIEGLPKGCYGIATRIHHSALDGAGMSRFMACMMDKDAKGTPAMPLDTTPVAGNARPSTTTMLNRATLNNLRAPIKIISSLAKAAPAAIGAARDRRNRPRHEKAVVPKTRFDVEVAAHKAFDGTEFELDQLKAIRTLVAGATINDVVLAICGSALRRYLEKHNELPDESLIAWVPVNARPGGARDNDAAGNNLAAMTVPIYTNIEDPVARLQCIHEKTQQRKRSTSGGSAKLMTELSKNLPALPQLIAGKLVVKAGLVASACNLFISNVAGSPVPLYMNGARQLTGFGMAPLTDGLGLFIAVPSYNGRIGFHVTSTREIMPDIRFFVECIDAGVAELKEATEKA